MNHSPSHPLEPFKRDIEVIEATLKEHASCLHPLIEEIIQYIILSGGKRIRPVLAVASARLFNDNLSSQIYMLSIVPEYLHAASLLHDDVVDKGELRRGEIPAYKIWGNKKTILSGDYLYATAIKIASDFNNPLIDRTIAMTVQLMAEGEVMQMMRAYDEGYSKEEYYSIIKRKTGALIACSCMIGALFGGADEEMAGNLYEFGLLIGNAFQIVDDLLDYTSDTSTLGKEIGADLKEGKITLPIIYALQSTENEGVKRLRQILKKKDTKEGITSEDIEWVRGFLSATQAIEMAFKEATLLIDKALNSLNAVPRNEMSSRLQRIARYIIERRY